MPNTLAPRRSAMLHHHFAGGFHSSLVSKVSRAICLTTSLSWLYLGAKVDSFSKGESAILLTPDKGGKKGPHTKVGTMSGAIAHSIGAYGPYGGHQCGPCCCYCQPLLIPPLATIRVPTGPTGPIGPTGNTDGWLLGGNTIPSGAGPQAFGTLNNFPIPIVTNGVEAARWTVPNEAGVTGRARLLVGLTGRDNGSSAGIQLASTTANQSQYRSSQYGGHTGNPGMSTFKSRGSTVGALEPVQVGDVIFGATAVGVTSNRSIPLSGLIQLITTAVPDAAGWIGTDFAVELVSRNGPANGRRRVFRITSEGVPQLYEQRTVMSQLQDGAAGLATIVGSGGSVTVANANVTADSRFTLTIQDSAALPPPVPVASVYVSARSVGTSFTISTIGPTPNPPGLVIYWQIWEPVNILPLSTTSNDET